MKFSSVQVSPESHHSTGTRPALACGGRNKPKRIVQPVASDSCDHTCWAPPKQRLSETFFSDIRR